MERSYFVPRSDWDNVRTILAADPAGLKALVEQTSKIEPATPLEKVIDQVQIADDSIKTATLLRFCVRMLGIAWSQGDSAEQLFDGIARYFDEAGQDWWDRKAWDDRRTFLLALVSEGSPLYVMGKVEALLSEQAAVMLQNRILTDCRFVFGDTDAPIIGGFVMQTLVIDYIDSGYSRQKLTVALDRNDMVRLGEQLKRAAEKEARLRQDILSKVTRDLSS